MGRLPHLVCVPVGSPLHTDVKVQYPAVDLAPAVAARIAAGRSIDLSRVGEGVLPTAVAAEVAGCAEARVLAWTGGLTFVGAADGLAALVAGLSPEGRAAAYLERHAARERLRRRRESFVALAGELKRARAEESNGYPALFFPDTCETVRTPSIPDYVRDRFRERDPIPFGFAVVESAEWNGISEGDLKAELDASGRIAFDLEAVIVRSIEGFGPGARADIVDERKLWRIVSRWLDAPGADAQAQCVFALARWNAMQTLRSSRVLRDVIVPTYEPVDRKGAIRWCRSKASEVDREIEAAEEWPFEPAG